MTSAPETTGTPPPGDGREQRPRRRGPWGTVRGGVIAGNAARSPIRRAVSAATVRATRMIVMPAALRIMTFRERRESGVAWNPLDRRYQQHPVPTYHELRQRDPVHRSRLIGGWVLTRFADCDAVLRDYETYSSDLINSPARRTARARGVTKIEPTILVMDPPDHTRLRALVAPAFTRTAIEAWRPRIERRVNELLDRMASERRVDIMDSLATPLPVMVIAEMLGVPPEDYPWFKEQSDAVARVLEPTATPAEGARAVASRAALNEYIGRMADERRREPQEDLISLLLHAEEEGDRLTHQELISMVRLLLIAGNETTTNLIGNGLLALLRHPEQLQWLREHPEQVDGAVEELLRYDSPVQLDQRTATRELEIGGQRIAAGEQVILLLGAANHDPERFADPDRLDLTRGDKNHLAFGRGIHHCLGAPLARLEGQLVFRHLVERFQEIRLMEETPPFKDHVVLRGLARLPVEVR